MSNNLNKNCAEKPLSGVVVLDLTQAYSGPFCTMHLADHGADVIKIEVPGKGDQSRSWAPFKNGYSGYYAYINRNKYGLTLNLKTEEGKNIFKKLVEKADVVCENFRVGTMERLGLGYDVLSEINPGLIYASISGFGLEGPRAQQPCYDIVAQAMGGMMSMTGFDRFTKVGPAIADNYSGTYLSLGIVMALYQRSRTGYGRRLDVSMLDTIFSILETGVVEYTFDGVISSPQGNRDPGISPFDSFMASDGEFVIACGTNKFWHALCELMQKPELESDPRFTDNAQRCKNNAALKQIIGDWAQGHTVSEVETLVVGAGIPFGRVLTMDQVCKQQELMDRNMLWAVDDPGVGGRITIPGSPIKMHGCEDTVRRPAPLMGEHSHDILSGILFMTDSDIEKLRKNGII